LTELVDKFKLPAAMKNKKQGGKQRGKCVKASKYTIKPHSVGSCFLSACLCLLSFAYSPQVSAGLFSVTPVRIYMAPKDRAIAVTLTNDGDEELVMQADIYNWKQKANGEDDLTLSEDLFLSPPIIKMAPKSRQVVRLARLSQAMPSEQLTYRMIVREIPVAKPGEGNVQVQIALAFSMPVFITPPKAQSKLDCKVVRLAQDKVQADCENTGTAYAQTRSLILSANNDVKLAGSEVVAYILPGIKRSYELKRSEGGIPSGKAKLAVSLDDGTTQNFDVMISE
jgi:fimbrial chaperone protein